ncbi:MAG TPA: WD40 repeat domain-containing protein, partial [Gemmataceae bacterium]|nr:WD40 repeat domain-containing protein [Gemmataceae bacterium]
MRLPLLCCVLIACFAQPCAAQQVRVDALGDPLPMGAVARFGTVRFRFTHGVAKAIFSNDGKTIFGVGASDSTSITAWEFPSGKVLRRYEVDKSHIGGVALAPDGKTLFASVNGVATLDIASGLVMNRYGGEPKGSGNITISPDGKWLAHLIEPQASRVRVREVETGKDVHILPATKGIISCLAFSPDSRKLAVVGDGRGVETWEMATGKLRDTYKPSGFTPSQAVFTPNGKWLVSAGSKTIRVLEVSTGKEIRRFGIEQVSLSGLAVTSDSKTLAVPNGAGKVTLFDLTTGLEIRTLAIDQRGSVTRVAFSPDDKVLLTTCTVEHVGLWDVATGKALHPQIGHTASVISMAISPDDRTVVSTDNGGALKLWDLTTGLERQQIKTSRRAAHIALGSDGKTLAVYMPGTKDELLLHIIDADNGRELKSFAKDLRFINAIALSPDCGTLAVAGSGDNITLWDVNTGQSKGQLVAKGSGTVYAVAFSPDGKKLLTGQSNNKEAWLWDLATLTVIHKLKHGARVRSVAFTPDGRTVVTGGAGDSAIHWNVVTGKELKRFMGHGGEVMKVAISPDGKLLATTATRGR